MLFHGRRHHSRSKGERTISLVVSENNRDRCVILRRGAATTSRRRAPPRAWRSPISVTVAVRNGKSPAFTERTRRDAQDGGRLPALVLALHDELQHATDQVRG